MSDSPPSSSTAVVGDAAGSKRRSEAGIDGQNEGSARTFQNQAMTNASYGGEMERRGEEKLLDEKIRERYQRELGDIFDESTA